MNNTAMRTPQNAVYMVSLTAFAISYKQQNLTLPHLSSKLALHIISSIHDA